MCLHAVFQLPFLFQTLYVFINAFVCARVCSLTMFFILSSSLLFFPALFVLPYNYADL